MIHVRLPQHRGTAGGPSAQRYQGSERYPRGDLARERPTLVAEEMAGDVVPTPAVRAPFVAGVAMSRMPVAAAGIEHSRGGRSRRG